MHIATILLPVFALAFWTSLVLMQIPLRRFRAGARRQVVADDFKYGESDRVPPHVSIPNRNYMNQLELPVLFYVVCVLIYVTATTSAVMVALAWVYVGLRVVHSLIHLTYNHVMHRMMAFAISNVVLTVLWLVAAFRIVPMALA